MSNDGLFQPGVEWMVINDFPEDVIPDDLRFLLQERGVAIIEARFNLGRSEARNTCARNSTADFIEFVDGDDVPLPLAGHEAALENPEMRLLHWKTQGYHFEENEIRAGEVIELTGDFCPGLLGPLDGVLCRPCALTYPREILLQAGGFDGRYDTIEDYHLLWKLDQTGLGVTHIDAVKQLYRVSGGPKRSNWDTHALHKLRFFMDVTKKLPDGDPTIAADIRDSYAGDVLAMAFDLLITHSNRARASRPAYLREVIQDPEVRSLEIFWQARKLLSQTAKMDSGARLREALKLLANR